MSGAEQTPTTPARFVVFGEALVDFIREGESRWRSAVGGAPWNVARAAARLGLPTGYAGGLSRDPFGEELWRSTAEAGVDLRFVQRVDRPTMLAMVVSKHPPHYFFVGDDTADVNVDLARLPAGWLEAVDVVYFGSISLLRPPFGAKLVELAGRVHAAGKRIVFDPNYRSLAAQGYGPTVRQVAALADHIKLSDEDLGGLFPGVPTEAALRELRALAPRAQILFTRGKDGMRLIAPEGEVEQPSFPVKVVDTVGAGDASVAGWVVSLLTRPRSTLQQHAAFSAAAAAVSCTHDGAYAPTVGEVEALIAGR